MANDITYKQAEDFCKKRDLVIVTNEVFQKMKPTWTWVKDPTQAFIEQKRMYETKISRQSHEIEALNGMVIELTKCATQARVRYDNIKSLLNRYIATGLMPGYFDIYNDLQDKKCKLKEARKEAAAANKRYKQFKKEFSRYRNEQIEAMNAYRELMNETKAQLEYVRDHADEMTHEEIVTMIHDIVQSAETKEEK